MTLTFDLLITSWPFTTLPVCIPPSPLDRNGYAFLMFWRPLMLSRLRCWVFWICQQRSTASITSFCCSDFDATLDLSTQCLRRRRRLSPAELSKCYTRAAFQPFSLSMGSTGICPWPHTVCLVYGWNRQNRSSARAQLPTVLCRWLTAKFTSPRL